MFADEITSRAKTDHEKVVQDVLTLADEATQANIDYGQVVKHMVLVADDTTTQAKY